MGQQVQTAFDDADEQDVVTWLASRGNWLCLPRIIQGSSAQPLPLGRGDTQAQVLFLGQSESELLSAVRPLASRSWGGGASSDGDGLLVATSEKRGLYVEWSRTRQTEPGVYVAGGSAVSRLYYQMPLATVQPCDDISRIVKGLFRYVRTTSPMLAPNDRYVGQHLAARVVRQEAHLVHPDGSKRNLTPNPRTR